MSQPTWVTPAGTLATIPEGVFYSTPLVATADSTVFYSVIAGRLPPGIQIDQTGTLAGLPEATSEAQGVPLAVENDTTSKFAVRAYTKTTVGGVTVITGLADRTFTITVTGQDTVTWTTSAGLVRTEFDGTQIAPLTLAFTDPDSSSRNTVSLVAGSLPPGLTISNQGVVTGYITPNPEATQTRNTYSFTLRVTNGISADVRTFSILVYARSRMTADNTQVTADNTFITADISPVQIPIITTPTGSIGSTRSDNFFAFQFQGSYYDGDPIEFEATTMLPPGLILDPLSGWLYGLIPFEGITSNTYNFSLRVRDVLVPSVVSAAYAFSLTVTGPVNSDVIWLTPADLGTIDNGATSTFYVAAENVAGLALQYQLQSGSDSTLPQGLQLLPSGHIAGRVSFDTFALDSGATTFDVGLNTVDQPTTFDLVNTFTVTAFSVNGLVNVNKTFSITVIRRYDQPFDNLYIQAMPPQEDRDLLASLLQNPSIFPPELIYRADDPNFGVARRVIYNHAYGLTATTLDDYVASMDLNHYWKNLVLGDIRTAQALDDAGNVIYEVVYSAVIDDLVNNAGQSVDKQVVLPFPINVDTADQIDSVYPNSLVNMRDQVIDVVGQVSRVLPRWMLTRQTDGSVLGFTPAWVIAYVKPGQSGQVAYNIQTQFASQLNLIDFRVDRYELDNFLTKNWDRESITLNINTLSGSGTTVTVTYATRAVAPVQPRSTIIIDGVNPSVYNGIYQVVTCTTSSITFRSALTNTYVSGGTVTHGPNWTPQPPTLTTFDILSYYELPVPNDSSYIFVGGINYAVGDQIRILGSQIGGVNGIYDPAQGLFGNNVTITVEQVDEFGTIQQARGSGLAPLSSIGQSYVNIAGTNITGTGTGATWDIVVVDSTSTQFDGNSLQFTAPVDMYGNTTDFDKYLMFPKRNILE